MDIFWVESSLDSVHSHIKLEDYNFTILSLGVCDIYKRVLPLVNEPF